MSNEAMETKTTPSTAPKDPTPLLDERLTQYLFDTQIQSQYKPNANTLVVSGLDITLDGCFDRNLKELRVYGHIVRINSALRSSDTANISIFCRYLIFGTEGSLDVSGVAGERKTGQALPGGEGENYGDPGKPGTDGGEGGAGTPGGRINILAETILGLPKLTANGGPGGAGQDGGKGGTGKIGAPGLNQEVRQIPKPGSKFRCNIIIIQHATPGGKGGQGGKGGKAGKRGRHGNGGTIYLRAVSPMCAGRLIADPGQSFVTDEDAKPGAGGVGGKGGVGGSMSHDPAKPNRMIPGKCPDGAEGGTDGVGDTPVITDQDKGTAGLVDIKAVTHDVLWQGLWEQESFLSPFSSDNSVLAMALFAAERLYLNTSTLEDAQAVEEVLTYLFRATAKATQPRMQAIHARCNVLLLNLERGLDYYGKLPNFIPSLSFRENKQAYEAYIKVALDLENDTDAFWKEEAKSRKAKAFLNKQKTTLNDLIEKQLLPQKELLNKSIHKLHDSISALGVKLMQQEMVIFKAQQSFHVAVLRKVECDQIMGILNVARCIIQAGVNVAPAFSGLKAFALLPVGDSQSFGERVKPLGTIAESVAKVQGNIQQLSQAYNTITKARATGNADSVKLVVKKEEFDELMKQFTGIPESQPYVEAMHAYMEIVNQRNTAITNHDAAYIQLDNLEKKIEVAKQETANLETQITEETNLLRPVFLQYIDQTLLMVKSLVIETLHSMARSLEYYTLSPKPLRFVDYRVSTLESHFAYLLSELNRAKEEAGAPSPFPAREVVISDPEDIERLKQGKPVWITLPLNMNCPPQRPFANIVCPLIRSVHCFLEGAKSNNPEATATIALEHYGVSHLYNEDHAQVWTFAHAQRTVSFEYRLRDQTYDKNQGDLTFQNQFMMLSPFATWGVQIRPEDSKNQELDLSQLTKVRVAFVGHGVVKQIGEPGA